MKLLIVVSILFAVFEHIDEVFRSSFDEARLF